MKDYLLIEKSKYTVSPVEGGNADDKYTLEGVFTEFDNENRNGRVYTKKEFQPHFDALKKIVKEGIAVGELDHPKQFETTLKNASHKIEDIWMDESNNRVMGRIKLIDTDAGRNAKALVDAGIPLHISSRAAGTVTEDKSVKIHKLFTYDLVDTPGFANARLSSCNESFGMINESAEHDSFSDFAIYEVGKQIKKDMDELNNKNKEADKMNDKDKTEFIKENEFNKYSEVTKEAIEDVKSEIAEMKEIQESIIEQNDSIVDEYSNADFKAKIKSLEERLEKLAENKDSGKELNSGDETIEYHVGDKYEDKIIRAVEQTDDGKTKLFFEDEDDALVVEAQAPLAKADALQVGTDYKGQGTITAVEVQDDGSTKVFIDSTDEPIIVGKTKVDDVINDDTLQESELQAKYDALEAKFEAMVKWSEEVTETVTALENWSDHSTETVSGMEKWTEHVTESVTAIEKWSEHVTESVSLLEEGKVEIKSEEKTEKINENKISDFKEGIYNKLESILEAKEQKATDTDSLNESEKVNLDEAKVEAPLWMTNMPAKYNETWKGLDESEKARITKRASLFEFKTESSIKNFWNNEFTKENLIKEDKTEDKEKQTQDQITEARLAKLRGFRMV
jgi:hypothetical protein